MADPKVSIVIPVYNGTNYMRAAIDSALAQTWPNTEVIVVNDGSRDEGATDAVARSYGDRIRYVAKPNGGVASALNAGIEAMTGDVFCWLSHDDVHLPEKTARQVEQWERLGRPDCILFSDYRLIDAAGAAITDVRMDHAMLEAKPIYALLRGAVHGCSVFVPRRLFDAVGRFDERLPTTQDYDLWFRMARRFRFRHMPEILILSRWHDEQGSKKMDHLIEATELWRRMMDGVPAEEQAALEGSQHRFYAATARFLRQNGLAAAAEHAEAQAERALENTLVSVVIPVHGRAEIAVSALDSALNQTHPSIEAIVVDDGSPATDAAVLEDAVAARAPRARLLRQENRGPAAARNAGWAAARGDYVAFLDADDLFLPGKVAAQLRAMEAAGAAFSHTSYWRHFQGTLRPMVMTSGTFSGENAFPQIIAECPVATPTVMLRRSLREEGFAFPETFRLGEDVVLWIRLAACKGLLGLDEPLSIVRAGPASAAYDPTKQTIGLRNILDAVRQDTVLAPKAAAALAQLATLVEAHAGAEKVAAALD